MQKSEPQLMWNGCVVGGMWEGGGGVRTGEDIISIM